MLCAYKAIRMKKHFLYILCLGILSLQGNSQNTKPNYLPLDVISYNTTVKAPLTTREMQQLVEVYGDDLNTEILSRPNRVLSMKNLLRNRIIIQKQSISQSKKKYTLVSEVPLFNAFVSTLERDLVFDPQNFNPLKYTFSFYGRGSHTYQVDGTDYIIVVKSQHQNTINQTSR